MESSKMWTVGLCSLPLGSQVLLAQNFDLQAIYAKTQIGNSLYEFLMSFEEQDVYAFHSITTKLFSKQQVAIRASQLFLTQLNQEIYKKNTPKTFQTFLSCNISLLEAH